MSHENIIRAWKDENFRNSLSETERVQLPDHPVGSVELTDTDLKAAAGGRPYSYYGDCDYSTFVAGCTNIWMCGPDSD
jgi:mersacidin/lichenicidin family type 2 lantibiotic